MLTRITIILVVFSHILYADPSMKVLCYSPSEKEVKCNNALRACINYSDDLKDSLKICNNEASDLSRRLDKTDEAILPWYVWTGIGMVLGGFAATVIIK